MLKRDHALCNIRQRAGLTQIQAAERMGIDNGTICNWENGRRKPKLKYIQKMATAYNVPISTISAAIYSDEKCRRHEMVTQQMIAIEKPKPGSGLELAPCPFCGSREIAYWQYMHEAGPRWKVFCCDCSAGADNGFARTKEQIQAVWNRRVNV